MSASKWKFKEKCIFLLPTLTIVLQWVTIAGINLSWVVSAFLLMLLVLKRNWIFTKAIPLIFFLIVLISPFFNFLFGVAGTFNFSLYISIATGLIYFLYVSSLEKKMFDKFMYGCLFSCIFFSIWGCYEIFTGSYLLSTHEILTHRTSFHGLHYPMIAFPNTNDVAQYLTLLFPLTSLVFLKKSKLLWAITSVLVFFVIYVSGSRLCMICFVGIWGLSLFWKLLTDRRAKTLLTLLVIFVLIIIGLIIINVKTGIVTSVLENFIFVDTTADYFAGREGIYAEVLAVASKLPLGGFGSAYVASDYPPHNFLLFILCDYGWIVCMLFVFVLIKFGFRYFKAATVDRDDLFMILLLSTLIMFPLLSSVSSTNEQRKVIWIALGIFMNQYLCYRKDGRKKAEISAKEDKVESLANEDNADAVKNEAEPEVSDNEDGSTS